MPDLATTRHVTPTAPVRPAGVILAGGQSRRMFIAAGSDPASAGDKGLLPLGETTMLGRVAVILGAQVSTLALNANGDPARFAALGLPVLADTVGGYVGPLAGVLAAMRWAAHLPEAPTHVVTAPSDAPFLPADLVSRLADAAAARPLSVTLARSGGDLHPVVGCWPVCLADALEKALGAGVRKVLRFTDEHGTIPVDFAFADVGGLRVDPFLNANTPAELAEARRHLARAERRMVRSPRDTPIIGIAGWKNAGKTTLAERLIAELTRVGFRVASVKHAHHAFQIDDAATDSARHRRAGAQQVAIVSPARLAIVTELGTSPEPDLEAVLAMLAPADVVVVEGYKRAPFPKIEVRRQTAQGPPLAADDPFIVAIASDRPGSEVAPVPVFDADDVAALARWLESALGLRRA